MQTFSLLYTKLDQTNSTLDKVEILSNFFRKADYEDAAWTIYIIMGKQKKRIVKRSTLVKVLEDISGFFGWFLCISDGPRLSRKVRERSRTKVEKS